MLQIRVYVPHDRLDHVEGMLVEVDGVERIVRAMAISPDLLPLAAACVGLQQRRTRLFLRSLSTLVVGLGVGTLTAGLSTAILRANTNLLCLLIGGTLTVVVQQSIRGRRGRAAATLPADLR